MYGRQQWVRVRLHQYTNVSRSYAQSMKLLGTMRFITEVNPIWALQTCMEGNEVTKGDIIINKRNGMDKPMMQRIIGTVGNTSRCDNNASPVIPPKQDIDDSRTMCK